MTRPKLVVLGLGAAIAFQLAVLVGMVVNAALPLWTGTEIRVRTVPVDPRSIFRGNYARLAYDFGTLPEDALPGEDDLRLGEVVYVSLEPGEGDVHEFAGASLDEPGKGVFLRGRLASDYPPYRIRYGIEAFFAPKEKALALEKDLLNGGIAILRVTGRGRAALKDVIPHPSTDRTHDAAACRELGLSFACAPVFEEKHLMTRRVSETLRGAGSIMDIYPAPAAYDRFIPKGTTASRLNAAWTRVGKHIRDAAREVRNESPTRPGRVG